MTAKPYAPFKNELSQMTSYGESPLRRWSHRYANCRWSLTARSGEVKFAMAVVQVQARCLGIFFKRHFNSFPGSLALKIYKVFLLMVASLTLSA